MRHTRPDLYPVDFQTAYWRPCDVATVGHAKHARAKRQSDAAMRNVTAGDGGQSDVYAMRVNWRESHVSLI
jgi:hypothetical protein